MIFSSFYFPSGIVILAIFKVALSVQASYPEEVAKLPLIGCSSKRVFPRVDFPFPVLLTSTTHSLSLSKDEYIVLFIFCAVLSVITIFTVQQSLISNL